jgi:hypothetical protein
MSREHFKHLRSFAIDTGNGELFGNKGGASILLIEDDDNPKICYMYYTICNPSDTFNKKEARARLRDMSKATFYPAIQFNNCDGISDTINRACILVCAASNREYRDAYSMYSI